MSAVDEQQARAALAWRLRDWGVADAEPKARLFIGELVARGWRMAPERESRPIPPKPAEACRTCGRHADRCLCDDGPTTRPPRPASDVTEHVARLRQLARPEGDA